MMHLTELSVFLCVKKIKTKTDFDSSKSHDNIYLENSGM